VGEGEKWGSRRPAVPHWERAGGEGCKGGIVVVNECVGLSRRPVWRAAGVTASTGGGLSRRQHAGGERRQC
jgi:hypothetical protein